MKTITQQVSKRNFFRFIFTMAFIGISFSSFAANYYFVTSGGGDWNTASNWKTGTATGATATVTPTAADVVFIDAANMGAGGTVTVASGATANFLVMTITNCRLENSGSMSATYSGSTSGSIITLNSAQFENKSGGSLSLTSSATANYRIPVTLAGSSIATASEFINSGNLTIDDLSSAVSGQVFNFIQTNANSQVTLNAGGTYTLNLKGGTAAVTGPPAVAAVKGTGLFNNKTAGVTAIIAGNASVTTSAGSYLYECDKATSVLKIASGSNLTFTGTFSGYPDNYMSVINGGSITNEGTFTMTGSATGLKQGIYFGAGNLTNAADASFTINGKFTNNLINPGTANLSTITNNGTMLLDNTLGGTAIGSTSGGGNQNFTNTGIFTAKAKAGSAALAFGNSTLAGTPVFTNSGTINVNSYIAGGSGTAAYNIYNSGTFNFDEATNASDAIRAGIVFQNSNAANTVGGTITGRGLIKGVFDNKTLGTIAPGNSTNAYGIFDFTAPAVSLTGIVNMDINGKTTAGADYDQIIASDVASTLNVTAATLNVTKAGTYTPSQGDIIPLFAANTTLTGPFASVSLPASWSLDYATNVLKAQVSYSTSTKNPADFNSTMKVYAVGNELVFDGFEGRTVSLYSITGKLIKSFVASETVSKFNVKNGLYIVDGGDVKFKVLIP